MREWQQHWVYAWHQHLCICVHCNHISNIYIVAFSFHSAITRLQYDYKLPTKIYANLTIFHTLAMDYGSGIDSCLGRNQSRIRNRGGYKGLYNSLHKMPAPSYLLSRSRHLHIIASASLVSSVTPIGNMVNKTFDGEEEVRRWGWADKSPLSGQITQETNEILIWYMSNIKFVSNMY